MRFRRRTLGLFLQLGLLLGVLAQPLNFSWAKSPPPSASESAVPYDFRNKSLSQNILEAFNRLEHRFNDETGEIYSPSGHALNETEVRALLKQHDLRSDAPSFQSFHYMGFQGAGYRFQEDTGAILSPDTKQPLSVIVVKAILHSAFPASNYDILERMKNALQKEDSNSKISKKTLANLRAMAKRQKKDLPPDLIRALKAGEASRLHDAIDRAYLESTRFWDNQQIASTFKIFRPLVAGKFQETQKKSVHFYEIEKRFSQELARDIETHFNKNHIGREIMDRLRNKKGVLDLPAFQILRMGPGKKTKQHYALAAYDTVGNSILTNFIDARKVILKSFPFMQRGKMRKLISTPKRLTSYLALNPSARTQLLSSMGTTFAHELTHAWQHARDPFSLETLRGNTPSTIPIENEHEAFVEQMRYLHATLIKNPRAAMRNADARDYLSMLKDFDQWRDNITQRYLEGYPEAAATFPTIASLQKIRVSAARRLSKENLFTGWVQNIKLLRLSKGTQAIQKAEKVVRSRLDEFRTKEYPHMRVQAYDKLAAYSLSRKRPGDYLIYKFQGNRARNKVWDKQTPRPPESSKQASDSTLRAATDALKWLSDSSEHSPLEHRLYALEHLLNYYAEKKETPPPALEREKQKLYELAFREYKALAQETRNMAERKLYNTHAQAYAKALGKPIDSLALASTEKK